MQVIQIQDDKGATPLIGLSDSKVTLKQLNFLKVELIQIYKETRDTTALTSNEERFDGASFLSLEYLDQH